jgi:choline dehydrogenase-like flavoprotein
MKRDPVDVCIVGSGAGGGPLAYALSRAGVGVVVLEKGPFYTEKDFTHDEIRTCRRDFFVPFVSDEPHLLQLDGAQAAPAQRTSDGWIANCVGGGTVHMSGFVYRLHEEDFRLASRYPGLPGALLADWPLRYEDLLPYYDQVERLIGVSGQAGEYPTEPRRTGPYPYPALRAHPLSRLVDEGARKLGLHPFQTPRAIISLATEGRAPCAYCQFCGSYGCEVRAKSSTAVSVIPMALATGRCQVRARCMAFEVVAGQDGLAKGVRYFNEAGEIEEQPARVVCVSASAIESARLLLNSVSPLFPHGLGNGSGLIGRNLSFSTFAKGWGTFPLPALPPELRGGGVHFLQRSLQDFYLLPERAGGYDKGGTLVFLLPHKNPIFTAERLSQRGEPPVWGAPLMQALRRHYHEERQIEFEVFGEFLPNPKTYVTVDGEVRDRFGLKVARIHLGHHEEDVKNSRLLLRHGLDVLEAAGAARTGTEAVGGTTFVLQQGTCRAGTDPSRSVLNPYCQSHEVKNLFVVDGSFLPTSGGVPSTLTILANSLRVGDYLIERLRRRDL